MCAVREKRSRHGTKSVRQLITPHYYLFPTKSLHSRFPYHFISLITYIGSNVQSTADNVLEGFVPAPSTAPAVPLSADAGSGTGTGTGTRTGTGMKAVDPTGLPMNDILFILQQAVSECIDADRTGIRTGMRADPSKLPADVPLLSLGMDSMRSIQLQTLLESRFTIHLSDELMFEPDATLSTIAHGKKSCMMF